MPESGEGAAWRLRWRKEVNFRNSKPLLVFSPPGAVSPSPPRLLVFCIPLLANIQHTPLSLSAPGFPFTPCTLMCLGGWRVPHPTLSPSLAQGLACGRHLGLMERMNEVNQHRGQEKSLPSLYKPSLCFCFWTSPKFIKDGWVFIIAWRERRKQKKKMHPFMNAQ